MSDLTVGQLKSYAEQAGFSGSALAVVVAIAMAESGGNTSAKHWNSGGSLDRGVLQINNVYHPEVSDACAYDPLCSFQSAYRISNGGASFSQWSTYTSGAYKPYLSSTSLLANTLSVNPLTATSTTGTNDNPLLDPAKPAREAIIKLAAFFGAIADPIRLIKAIVGLVLIGVAVYLLIQPSSVTISGGKISIKRKAK